MRYETIADIYSANQKMRENLIATLNDISPDEATALPDGEKWSIQQIAEHLSMVDFGISRICAKLLEGAKAVGKSSDGGFSLSPDFGTRAAEMETLKVEAPDRVQPTGSVTIAEAIAAMTTNRAAFESIRNDLERYDHSEPKFPHPFLGDLTAGEWLVIAGLHEQRHTKQIKNLAAKIRQ
jgi:hypothetical protein